MADILALDPSINSSGVALFRDEILIDAKTIKVSLRDFSVEPNIAQRCLFMSQAVLSWLMQNPSSPAPTRVVIEWPQIYREGKAKKKDDVDRNSLLGLSGVGMAVAANVALLAGHAGAIVDVHGYTPREWSDGVPKTIKRGSKDVYPRDPYTSPRGIRIDSRLQGDERKHVYPTASHDMVDAIGLGLHDLGRLQRVRVFPGAS